MIYDGLLRPVYPDILRRFGELLMADKSVATSVDVLTTAERSFVVVSLEMKLASLNRSIRSEPNPAVRTLRSDEADAVSSLIAKFR